MLRSVMAPEATVQITSNTRHPHTNPATRIHPYQSPCFTDMYFRLRKHDPAELNGRNGFTSLISKDGAYLR
jgi:hypothetical protein